MFDSQEIEYEEYENNALSDEEVYEIQEAYRRRRIK